MESSAAATWLSAWVSTPPVIARVSTMVNAIPFLCVEGWHAPAGRRTCETPASSPGQADQTGRAGGCREILDPGRQIVSQDNPSGVSRFGGQAGTQAPDPMPAPPQTGEAGPEAPIRILPADSLPCCPRTGRVIRTLRVIRSARLASQLNNRRGD